MGIKNKKVGPQPKAPTFEYEWQTIAYEGDVGKAVAAHQRRHSSQPSEAMKAVKKFMEENRCKRKVA